MKRIITLILLAISFASFSQTVSNPPSGSTLITSYLSPAGIMYSGSLAKQFRAYATLEALDTKLNLSGGTMTGDIQQIASPVNANSLITKGYVDNALTGISWKNAVRLKTTGNITLSGLQIIDGVSVVAGDRVLVNSQTTPSQNGIYLVSSGSWMRASDADEGVEIASATVAVTLGTFGNTQWTCATVTPIIVGTTSISFVQISGAGTYTNGTGLLLTGNAFSIDPTYTANGSKTGYLNSTDWAIFSAKANDNAVVHLAGIEQISGQKTFAATSTYFNSPYGNEVQISTNAFSGLTPSIYSGLINLISRASDGSSAWSNSIIANPAATATTQNTTPRTSGTLANSVDLALKANDNAVVHLAGAETLIGTKTFTPDIFVNGNINKNDVTGQISSFLATSTFTDGVNTQYLGGIGLQYRSTAGDGLPVTNSIVANSGGSATSNKTPLTSGTLANSNDLATKQDQLSGTGFVKAVGTTVSYDNTTYYPASNPNSYGTGTVSNVTSANTDIGVATGTTTPVLTLNSGSGANQIVKRDGSGNVTASIFIGGNLQNSSSVNNANIAMGTSGTVVSRNINDTSPALTVNSVGTTATNIALFQTNGSSLASIDRFGGVYASSFSNVSGQANAAVMVNTTGTVISRTINDANTALKVNQAGATSTGRILDLQMGGVSKFYVLPSGIFGINNTAGTGGQSIRINAANTAPEYFTAVDASLILGGSTTVTLGSIAAGGTATTTITVTGCALSDVVDLGLPTGIPPQCIMSAFVSAVNTVTIQAYNSNTLASMTINSGTYKVKVLK